MIAYGSFTRLHLFRAKNHHEIVANVVQAAQQHLNVDVRVVASQITLAKFEGQRFGQFWKDNFQTSMAEFVVQKLTDRHPEPVKRILCLTEATILERDPQTYSVRFCAFARAIHCMEVFI